MLRSRHALFCLSVNCDVHIYNTILLTDFFNDPFIYQIAEAEEQTAGGLLLMQATKEKPAFLLHAKKQACSVLFECEL